jgi:hypothetical protein
MMILSVIIVYHHILFLHNMHYLYIHILSINIVYLIYDQLDTSPSWRSALMPRPVQSSSEAVLKMC